MDLTCDGKLFLFKHKESKQIIYLVGTPKEPFVEL